MPNDKKTSGTEARLASNSGGEEGTRSVSADLNVILDEPTQALIGHCLKAVYAEIVEQPVPEQLL